MPGFRIHKKIGGITALILSILFIILFYKNIPTVGWKLLLIPLIVITYSQIPDLDSYTSRIKKRFLQLSFWIMILSLVISLFINIYLVFILLIITGIFGLYLLKIPHRGPLHSFWFVFIASLPLLYIHWFLALLAFICASSHILADRIYSNIRRKIKRLFGIRSENHYHIKLFGG